MKEVPKELEYPVGIQSFAKIREEGFVYVDKTRYVYSLIKGKGFYFLSRPRRFGKSLLVSTLEAYYQGRRDLFEGLALAELTDNWEPHPVLHLDLNNREYRNRQSLVDHLNAHLEIWEEKYGNAKPDRSPEERFANVIRGAYRQTGKKVVILVDEYDKPLLSAIGNESLADQYRSLLKAFYGNLKSLDSCIEFGFMTGVARFSKVSIFSDLNNLRDISFINDYSAICGITPDELDQYFGEGITRLADARQVSEEEMRRILRRNYDGYHFAPESEDVYNPFSLISVFANKKIASYWADSATPTYLVTLIQRQNWRLQDISPIEIDADILERAGILEGDPIPSLYQSGYLTIKEYDPIFNTYLLAYPNEEVRDGFVKFLIPFYVKSKESADQFSVKKFVQCVSNGNIEGFMNLLNLMLAGIPYAEKGSAESHFQNAAYVLFTLMDQYVKIEDRTSDGRIDLTVETDRYIYIFEFKIDTNPTAAMDQIHAKKYWTKYLGAGKQIFLIGASFDTCTRRLSGYLVEKI